MTSPPYTPPDPPVTVAQWVALAEAVLDEQTVRAADRTNMCELARAVLALSGAADDPAKANV